MKIREYHIILILLFLVSAHAKCQQLPEYRIKTTITGGYQTLDLDEVIGRLTFNIKKLKPYQGSSVFSAGIEGRPFKNKFFFLKFRYDYLPDNIRNYSTYEVDTSMVINSGKRDTFYKKTVISVKNTTAIFFLSLQGGVDLTFDKLSFNAGCGLVYGNFSLYQSRSVHQSYKFNGGQYFNNPYEQDQKDYFNYHSKDNFGFITSISLSYKFYRRLQASINFSALVLDPVVTYYDGTIWAEDGHVGFKSFGYYYPRVLTAHLSGIQISAGLVYTIL
jgi:hypothetical protein